MIRDFAARSLKRQKRALKERREKQARRKKRVKKELLRSSEEEADDEEEKEEEGPSPAEAFPLPGARDPSSSSEEYPPRTLKRRFVGRVPVYGH